MLAMTESVAASERKDQQAAKKMRTAVKCFVAASRKRKPADEDHAL